MSVALSPATEQLAMLASGKISASELAEEHIRRIKRLNPLLHAFVEFNADDVLRQARTAAPGPLHGLPVSIKSSISVAGRHCEIGSTLRRGDRADHDADAVRRLREAGAVILGMTNCPENLMAYETDNLLYGTTRSPWDLERTPGGSSGGEAAAIAAGMSAGGLGSDSGGSVRQPAHYSGICAFKPTSGRISPEGHVPPNVGPFATLGSIGPMARTAEDVRLLYRVASGDRAVPTVTGEAPQAVRIAFMEDADHIPATPETRAAVRAAAEALQERGFIVERIEAPPSFEEARVLWDVFFVQCGALFYEPDIAGREEALSPVFRDFLRTARSRTPLTAASLLGAWAQWQPLQLRMREALQPYTAVLTPVCAVPAFRHGERSWRIEGRDVTYLEAMAYTQWFNLLGAPAAVVPVGASPEGLPIGVQVAGVPGADADVLEVAATLDRCFGYKPPPLAL